MYCTRVLVLILLLVGLVHSFSWDVVLGGDKKLEFYYNGTLTHTEDIPSVHRIESVTYDPVHYRVLFAGCDDNCTTISISSFDLSTRKIQCLLTKNTNYDYPRVVYDPFTQVLYWKEGFDIWSLSLNPTSSNKTDANVIVEIGYYCHDIALDSCGGYIYWITKEGVERARLDGSEREVVIHSLNYERFSLAIDQQTQKIYWTERIQDTEIDGVFLESADFNGKNRTTLHIIRKTGYALSLATSKDFIYWQNVDEQTIWQLPKNEVHGNATKIHSMSSSDSGYCQLIAANYTIKEQIEGINSCDALQVLIPNNSRSDPAVSICQNYCFQGEYSVSAEGQPTCSCKAGYSGERCEVNVCHDYCLHGGTCSVDAENKRVCQCTAGYGGERCDVSFCNEYCLQGNCSVDANGHPICSCMAGYSGERCEVNACHKHCLNGGVCSLDEEGEPACQCTEGYDGGRCEVSANSCDPGNSGEGTVSACHQFCLNDGACSLNEASEPVCQCTAGYEGDRCEASVNKALYCPTVTKVTITLGQEAQSTCASTVV